MNSIDELLRHAPEIEAKIGYRFDNRKLLALAFTHRSFVNESRTVTEHNERLEFLGDSVLGLLIAEYLFRYLPSTPEGELSVLRSCLVEASACLIYTNKLEIDSYVLLSKGEKSSGGRGRESILADLFEALIGAIYLDGGIEAAKGFLFKNFSTEIGEILKMPLENWKAELQDWSQRKFRVPPTYEVLSATGPDHSKTFRISVKVNDKEIGLGEGSSKKEAQQAAAKDALSRIEAEQ